MIRISPAKLLEAIRGAQIDGEGYYLITFEEENPKKITPEDYHKFDNLLKAWNINLKDIREIIRLSYAFWIFRQSDPRTVLESIFEYSYTHPTDKIYSEELIRATIDAISVTKNISTDLYSRLLKTNPQRYDVFEDFYKHLYESKE